MSTVENETVESVISDDSRVLDAEQVATLKQSASKLLKSLRTTFGKLAGQAQEYARTDLHIRTLILTANGIPNWNAQDNADQYTLLVGNLVGDAFEGMDRSEATTLKARIRKAVERERVAAVVAWIGANEDDSIVSLPSEEREAINAGGESLARVIGSPSNALRRRVQDHYTMSGLNIPPTSPQFKPTGETNGNGDNTPSAPTPVQAAAVAKALEGGKVAPSGIGDVMTLVHREVTGAAKVLFTEPGKVGEIDGRQAAGHSAERASALLALVAKFLNAPDKFGEQDLEQARSLYFAATESTEK